MTAVAAGRWSKSLRTASARTTSPTAAAAVVAGVAAPVAAAAGPGAGPTNDGAASVTGRRSRLPRAGTPRPGGGEGEAPRTWLECSGVAAAAKNRIRSGCCRRRRDDAGLSKPGLRARGFLCRACGPKKVEFYFCFLWFWGGNLCK